MPLRLRVPALTMSAPIAVHRPLPPHEQGRADLYALIGSLLLQPPQPLLQALAEATPAPPDDTESSLARAWRCLLVAARGLGPRAVVQEHAALFVAVGAPAVDPYASRYLAGFLMDEPLARLRADLRALGLARRPEARHTEDHLGALCETLRLLIQARPLADQRRFFEQHLMPWAGACLHDIREAPEAHFYAALADLAEVFFATECEAFALEDEHDALTA